MTLIQLSSKGNNEVLTGSYEVKNWRHRSSASYGFHSASFDIEGTRQELEKFFDFGLGYYITVYDRSGQELVWRGHIVEMSFQMANVKQRKSLRNIYNRISVKYEQWDTSTNPPTVVGDTTTTPINDTDSQSKYGIKELVVKPSVQGMTSTMAGYIASTALLVYKEPKVTREFGGGESALRLNVRCEGMMLTLGWQVYNQTTSSGTSNASTVINAVVAASEFMSVGTGSRSIGSVSSNQYFDNDQYGLAIIQQMLSLGDGGTNRAVCYCMNADEEVYYMTASSEVTLVSSLSDTSGRIYNLQGANVPYELIKPDTWLRILDLNPMTISPADVIADPQTIYIESVEYDAESDRLNIQGSIFDEFAVLSAFVNANDINNRIL